MPAAKKAGVLVAAIAVDQPEYLAGTAERQDLSFELLSDPDLQAMNAYNLVAKVEDETFTRYEKNGFKVRKIIPPEKEGWDEMVLYGLEL